MRAGRSITSLRSTRCGSGGTAAVCFGRRHGRRRSLRTGRLAAVQSGDARPPVDHVIQGFHKNRFHYWGEESSGLCACKTRSRCQSLARDVHSDGAGALCQRVSQMVRCANALGRRVDSMNGSADVNACGDAPCSGQTQRSRRLHRVASFTSSNWRACTSVSGTNPSKCVMSRIFIRHIGEHSGSGAGPILLDDGRRAEQMLIPATICRLLSTGVRPSCAPAAWRTGDALPHPSV